MHTAAPDRLIALPEWLASSAGQPVGLRWHVLPSPQGVEPTWWRSAEVTALTERWPTCWVGQRGELAPAADTIAPCQPDEVAECHTQPPDGHGPR